MTSISFISHNFSMPRNIFPIYCSFLSFSSVLRLSQYLLFFLSYSSVSHFSWMCCQAFHFKFHLDFPFSLCQKWLSPFWLHLPLKRKVKQRLNYILFYTMCSHYTQSLPSPPGTMWQITIQKSSSRGKKKEVKITSFYTFKNISLTQWQMPSTFHCTWLK